MKTEKKKSIALAILFLLFFFFIWQNNSIVISKYLYSNAKIPESFDGFKILQISDLHNKDFRGKLSKMIEELDPDIIVITGDLIDRRNTNIDTAIEVVKRAQSIAPVYWVSGNHEELSDYCSLLQTQLMMLDATILDNSYQVLNRGEDSIGLMGVRDPSSEQNESTYLLDSNVAYMSENIDLLQGVSQTRFNIMLSHRPELFSVYRDKKVDLVFCGHAHGGQIRLPFIGGVIAPNQGLLPKYTEGIFCEDSTTMVVSRGLGNSLAPLRVFNPPEIVVVTFKYGI